MQLITCLSALVVLAASGGCKQYAKADFQVAVTNRTDMPLTAGFVKDGPPSERHWAAPHEIAMGAGKGDQWGVLIRPGQTATVGPISGKFDRNVSAILRVFASEGDIDDLMGFSRTDPHRADIYLMPGQSHYVIDLDRGRLAPSRAPGSASGSAPAR